MVLRTTNYAFNTRALRVKWSGVAHLEPSRSHLAAILDLLIITLPPSSYDLCPGAVPEVIFEGCIERNHGLGGLGTLGYPPPPARTRG